MIKALRSQEMSSDTRANQLSMWAANNFSTINNTVPKFLNAVNLAHKVCVIRAPAVSPLLLLAAQPGQVEPASSEGAV
jgi:hypothetical protein